MSIKNNTKKFNFYSGIIVAIFCLCMVFAGGEVRADDLPIGTPTGLSAYSPASAPELSWNTVSGAIRYDVYRDGVQIGSSNTANYVDSAVISEGSHSYYVKAFDGSNESLPSNSINMVIDQTPPSVSYSIYPLPNSHGWNNSDTTVNFSCIGARRCSSPRNFTQDGANQIVYGVGADAASNVTEVPVTVNIDKTAPYLGFAPTTYPNNAGWYNADVSFDYTCADELSGIEICPASHAIEDEGMNQWLYDEAKDFAGNITGVNTYSVNIDKTPPTVSSASVGVDTLILEDTTITISANAADSLAGVAGGEYYIDTDPGLGNGVPMTYEDGLVKADTAISSDLNAGTHHVYVRIQDAAGNWSDATSVSFLKI